MKKIIPGLLIGLAVLSGCGEEPVQKKPQVEELIEVKDGVYTEYYPGRKAIKFRGPQNEQGLRDGRWFFYDEKGNEMSMTEYTEGKKNGFIFVRYPDGNMRYTGEYIMDKETGLWRFYDETGNVSLEKDYNSETQK